MLVGNLLVNEIREDSLSRCGMLNVVQIHRFIECHLCELFIV